MGEKSAWWTQLTWVSRPLSQIETNYRFFKGMDVRDPASGCPHFAAWLEAIEGSRGGVATWQSPGTDQRVMQAHPDRRAAAEPCMGLHPTKLGVGEDPDWEARLATVAPEPVPLAAWRLCERRTPLAGFLSRKSAEYAAGAAFWKGKRHPKAGGRDWKQTDGHWEWVGSGPPPFGQTDQSHRFESPAAETEEVGGHLLIIAAVLVGVLTPGGASAVGGPAARLGGLIGTPPDMSSGAAAQVKAALSPPLRPAL